MTIRVVVDMNLSPDWARVLSEAGFEAVHWRNVGHPNAADSVIMSWAREHNYVVFTHDLDFGTLLAVGGDATPSVLQIRAQDVLPKAMAAVVLQALHQFEGELTTGALVVVDERRSRVRLLPI
ncbi:MAG: DUF5615 family PIN-like protein [Hyphomicrobium aestuarii]|nr:DUF5615 family PIN-like protein [Hyphomicrobium aestuarii]